MNNIRFQVNVNKRPLTLTAEQLTIYKQTKIIEATDKNSNFYYVLFFKNKFINGVKAKSIRLHSYIHQALKKGIHFNGNHPFIAQLIGNKSSFQFVKFNQLIKSLPRTYNQKEIAFIFLFFNSFTKQGTSKKLFKHTFYEYHRNGQDFIAYQLLKYYSNYYSKDKFVYDMLHNLEFKRYEKHYADAHTMVEKDPDYTELICFDERHHQHSASILFKLHKKQNREMDELAVRINLLNRDYSNENFCEIKSIIETFHVDEQIQIMKDICDVHPVNNVKDTLVSLLLANENANEIVQFILSKDIQIDEKRLPLVAELFQEAHSSVLISNFPQSNQRLLSLSNGNREILERLITPLIHAYINEYDLHAIIKWFEPFHKVNIHLPIEQRLNKMMKLENDPDQQFALGELYLDFHQLEKSIDCFKWEMELHPEDPRPVIYLSKIYSEMGNQEEANAYQRLMIQMTK
ncbi:tetratricopeptide repeat protein [Oceanobacillus senegalensis]|uniref:tetratricopeptide repeat protein n=1 Tax=Oceanobacillus senegalensis TaxID=1936063 RepID=UPI000A310592|nr:hypothetical protein [Oceanobacillus senegalensis]